MLIFIVSFVITFLVMLIAFSSFRLKMLSFKLYIEHIEKFYDCASELLKNDNISNELISYVEMLNFTITDKRTASSVLKAWNISNNNNNNNKHSLKLCKIGTSVDEQLKVERLMAMVVVSWFNAITRHSPVSGLLLKAKLDSIVVPSGKNEGKLEAAVKKVSRNQKRNQNLQHC